MDLKEIVRNIGENYATYKENEATLDAVLQNASQEELASPEFQATVATAKKSQEDTKQYLARLMYMCFGSNQPAIQKYRFMMREDAEQKLADPNADEKTKRSAACTKELLDMVDLGRDLEKSDAELTEGGNGNLQ